MHNSSQPYTYLIGWSKYKKYYYGVRYAKNCLPTDLWIKYFTSSLIVASTRLELGEPDIIQVRKIFVTKEQARNWETKVLKRMKVVVSELFLNKNDRPAPPISNRPMSEYNKKKLLEAKLGKPRSDVTKQKLREARSHQIIVKGRVVSVETRQKIRDANLGKTMSTDTKAKISAGNKGKHFDKRSVETRQKIRDANLGKTMSADTKDKISAGNKGKPKPITQCPHCLKFGGVSQMQQWHFNKCKLFKKEI